MQTGTKRSLLVAGVVLLQLIAVYTLVLSLQRELASQFSGNARITLNELADGAVDRSRRVLPPVRDAVSVGVDLMNQGILDDADDAALESYFDTQLGTTPWLAGMFLGRADGSFVYLARNEFGLRTKRIILDGNERTVRLVQRDTNGVVSERWNDAEDAYDPRERSWYKAAVMSETVAWTEPYAFFSSGLPGISAASRAESGVILGADVELAELSAFVDAVPHAEGGTALIIDSSLNVLASSGSIDMSSQAERTGISKLSDVASAPLMALDRAAAESPHQESLVELRIDDETYLGLTRVFPIAEGARKWTLMLQMRADDYAGGALNFFNRQIALLAVLTIGLGTLTLGGLLWLHRTTRATQSSSDTDPISGALTRPQFDGNLARRLADKRRDSSVCTGVMVVEVVGLRRLSDRSGTSARDSVVAEMSDRLRAVLAPEDLLGISPSGRFLIALTANSRTMLHTRFEQVHRAIASNEEFSTPFGARKMAVASGAAVLENDEPALNLLPRAREALAAGIEKGESGCQIARGLDEHGLDAKRHAA